MDCDHRRCAEKKGSQEREEKGKKQKGNILVLVSVNNELIMAQVPVISGAGVETAAGPAPLESLGTRFAAQVSH